MNWFRAATLACVLITGDAFAFSSNGHEAIGAIADKLLAGSRAGREVQNILGGMDDMDNMDDRGGRPMTLHQAAVWPDCARGVHPQQGFGYRFVYRPGEFRDKACALFEDEAGMQAMVDYVKRNNTHCDYAGPRAECHKSFHFTDVALQHNDYKMGYVGTNDHDIVHAIAASIAVLEGKPCPAPFDIADKKEALMLLAHFVGDLHQPLHVGAIYLNKNGDPIDPETGAFDPGTGTRGGNSLTVAGGNLHRQWDETKYRVHDPTLIRALADKAESIQAPAGAYANWPTIWAGDTVKVARKAFVGVRFGKKTGKKTGEETEEKMWPATFANREAYSARLKTIQHQQIVKGGARLAQLLRAIWPD